VRATAHPTTDDVVAFRDEIRSARETQIGERFAERVMNAFTSARPRPALFPLPEKDLKWLIVPLEV
jgi:hypothetical protein